MTYNFRHSFADTDKKFIFFGTHFIHTVKSRRTLSVAVKKIIKIINMYFSLIDRIVSLEPGKNIVATKSLSMGEEYLRDHFPKFPVMPGVLMIEAMTQSSAWLMRVTEDFAHSMVILKAVKNVKFGKFLQPGQTMTVTAKLVEQNDTTAVFKTEGLIDGQSRVRAQLTLAKYNLAESKPHYAVTDRKVVAKLREELQLLWEDAPQTE